MRITLSYLFTLLALSVTCGLAVLMVWGVDGPLPGLAGLLLLSLLACFLGAALVLAARRLSTGVWILIGLVTLIGLALPGPALIDLFRARGEVPFGYPEGFLLLLPAAAALVVAALLVYAGLRDSEAWAGAIDADPSHETRPHRSTGAAAAALTLAALLLVTALYRIFWVLVWDATYDSLGFLWLFILTPIAVFTGALLAILSPSRWRWVGAVYALLLGGLFLAVSAAAQQVDFGQLTEARAQRIAGALESYYTRKGRYPEDLSQLVPRDSIAIPGPIILYGQGWCYVGGGDSYLLGYVTRDHWSDPRLWGKVSEAIWISGNPPQVCADEVAAIQARYPEYPFSYWTAAE